MPDRLTLALPIDVARVFDHTVTQTQLANNTFQGTPDDKDVLSGHIEDAEDEFRSATDTGVRLSRTGSPGNRETYEQVTHKVKGHQAFKRTFSRTARDYAAREVRNNLAHTRILPFDSTAGDEAHVWRGVSRAANTEWEDITDDIGDTWDIIDYRNGIIVLDPVKLHRAMVAGGHGVGLAGNRLDEVRIALTYRHGALGGGRAVSGAATLDDALSQGATPDVVALTDAERLPGLGDVELLIGDEYLLADIDPGAGTMNVLERGNRGTTDVAHSAEDRVQYTPGAVRKAVASRAAMALIQAGRYSAWLPDADDAIDKSDMLESLESTWSGTVEALA